MRIAKEDIPTRIDVPGAKVRHAVGFGAASQYGSLAAEYLSLGAGTDIAPLLRGLEQDSCQAPHWGFLLAGELVVSYTDGRQETCRGGDLLYWPPGHSVKVIDDAELILFSPQVEHGKVMDHMLAVMAG